MSTVQMQMKNKRWNGRNREDAVATLSNGRMISLYLFVLWRKTTAGLFFCLSLSFSFKINTGNRPCFPSWDKKINEFIFQAQNQIRITKIPIQNSSPENRIIHHLPLYSSRNSPPEATLQGSLYQPSDTIPLSQSIISTRLNQSIK